MGPVNTWMRNMMSVPSHEALFNLRVVLQETGLKADTVRAWERRYGLPRPQRSGGGHRLYSSRDIETLKWLVRRQGEGMAISRATEWWHRLEAAGEDPLRASIAPGRPPESAAAGVVEGREIESLKQQWLEACLSFDERRANQVLAHAFALFPVETVCFRILQENLARIGQDWYQGAASVQQEHFASALAVRPLESLLAAAPPASRPQRILVACPPDELHAFAPLLLTLLFRRCGWAVTHLGADVPVERLREAVAATHPDWAVFPAQQLHTAASLLRVASVLREEAVGVAFGGLIFNSLPVLRQRIPGSFLGATLAEAPEAMEKLIFSPPAMAAVQPVPRAYHRALTHFEDRRARIEAMVWEAESALETEHQQLAEANLFLGRGITAGLTLGDMHFLDADMDWLAAFLVHRSAPENLLRGYLEFYYQAAGESLDNRGSPVLAWLSGAVEAARAASGFAMPV
jgi:DNA-binding transcriptional MerR regulator